MEGRATIPKFLTKTYEMVNNPSTDCLISWSLSGTSFVIWRKHEFTEHLLPLFFNHNNFSSFNRQLNKYGFNKIDKYRWEFANRNFLMGQPELLKNIMRRPTTYSLPLAEARHLREEAKRLRREKRVLQYKVEKLEERKQSYQKEIQRLKVNTEKSEKGLELDEDHKKRKCSKTCYLLGKKANIFEDIIKDKAKLLEIDLNSLPDSDVPDDPVDCLIAGFKDPYLMQHDRSNEDQKLE